MVYCLIAGSLKHEQVISIHMGLQCLRLLVIVVFDCDEISQVYSVCNKIVGQYFAGKREQLQIFRLKSVHVPHSYTGCFLSTQLLPRSHAFLVTELAYAYLQPGAICGCLSYGKLSASFRRPHKGAEKACVYAQLPRGAKFADSTRHTRFVCAILRLLHGARIRGLRKKIRTLRPTYTRPKL